MLILHFIYFISGEGIMQTTTTFATLRRSARQLAVAATLGMAAVGAQAQAQTQTQAAPAQQQQAAFGIDSFVNAAASYLTAITQGKAAEVWKSCSPEMQKNEAQKSFAKNIEAKYAAAGQITARMGCR